jgi:D-xylono/L-arabinono-1,4-lactonase
MDRDSIAVWREGTLTSVLAGIEEERDSRFNDVIADPGGRVFCGTMLSDAKKGSLYRLELDGSLHRVVTGIGCSNGMAFTRDQTGFYFTDPFARVIYLFDYSAEDGTLTTSASSGVLMNQAEYRTGPRWTPTAASGQHSGTARASCRWMAGGRIEQRISLPASKTSSLTFRGEDYGDIYIYITAAGGDRKREEGPLGRSFD